MDISTPIDIEAAINGLGGEPTIFYMMLGQLEAMSVIPTLTDIVQHFENKNYKEMKGLAHSLKGASGYIGASRLYYVCYYI